MTVRAIPHAVGGGHDIVTDRYHPDRPLVLLRVTAIGTIEWGNLTSDFNSDWVPVLTEALILAGQISDVQRQALTLASSFVELSSMSDRSDDRDVRPVPGPTGQPVAGCRGCQMPMPSDWCWENRMFDCWAGRPPREVTTRQLRDAVVDLRDRVERLEDPTG